MDETSLSKLKAGEEGTIVSADLNELQKRRLEEIGFVPGSKIRILQTAPSGSPIAYYIKGTVIALRAEDAKKIQVYRDADC